MIIVVQTNRDIATHDKASDWEIDPDGMLTIVDGGLEPIAIYNCGAWISATRAEEPP